jgi:hypothetical protein
MQVHALGRQGLRDRWFRIPRSGFSNPVAQLRANSAKGITSTCFDAHVNGADENLVWLIF